jgi:hypothetical protein
LKPRTNIGTKDENIRSPNAFFSEWVVEKGKKIKDKRKGWKLIEI